MARLAHKGYGLGRTGREFAFSRDEQLPVGLEPKPHSSAMKEPEKLTMGMDRTAPQVDSVEHQPDVEGQRSSWLTAEEAAEHLRVRTRTLLLWARQGKVKGYVLSGLKRHVWRFRRVDLDATLELPSVRPEGMVQ